jgi:hypothetical protein
MVVSFSSHRLLQCIRSVAFLNPLKPGAYFVDHQVWHPNILLSAHRIYLCRYFVCRSVSEETAIVSLYCINWLVCITETECVYCAVRTVFMCFVWISEQTVIISLYNINWLVCITETECVYCAVRTVFMCFVWISEQTSIISLYNINWLVCITETECVYCAVRSDSLNEIQFNPRLQRAEHNVTLGQ